MSASPIFARVVGTGSAESTGAQTTADLAEQAGRQALIAAGIDPHAVGALIVATVTPDLVFPNLGCLLQSRFEISGCPAFSLEASGGGFVYALSVAERFVVSGQLDNALVIGADTLSRLKGEHDSAADGAGAWVLRTDREAGLWGCRLGSHEIDVPATDAVAESIDLIRSGTETDLRWLAVQTSAPVNIGELTSQLAEESPAVELLPDILYRGTATLPVAVDRALRANTLQAGDALALAAFGDGHNWGSAIIRV